MTLASSRAFWRDRPVFVTGHTGFKGAWLCLLLARLGARVTGYALPPPTQPSLYELARASELVRSVEGDIRDRDRLAAAMAESEPSVVIHMAAQSVVLDSYTDPIETYSTNVVGTASVLDAIRRTGRRVAVVNVTTDKCYHNQDWVWGYRETDPLGGRDPYSNSKACAELVAQSFRASFFSLDRLGDHGVAIASARAGNVVGGGDWTPHQLVPAVVAAYERGEPVALRHPSAIRPWQHVLDCLAGYLALAEALTRDPAEYSGEWNFGPALGDTHTVSQVAEALACHWAISPAWTHAQGERSKEERELRLDCSKVERMLGWRCALTTAQALDWVAHWYLRTRSGEGAREVTQAQIDAFLAGPGRPSSPGLSA